jgi:hypothetical protein
LQLYRHSYYARYQVLVIDQGTLYNVSDTNNIRMIQWAPNSESLVFVQDNNIRIVQVSDTGVSAVTNVTSDGEWNHIINGAPDWLYEEEILASNSALWWASDSANFAFIK